MTSESDTKVEQPNLAEELVYEHIKEAPQQQMEMANWLDDKMLRIFGAASIVIGFLGLSSSSSLAEGFGWKAIFLLLPLVPYAFTAVWAFWHIDPDKFHWGMRADELPVHWNEREEQVRRALISDIGESYSKNKPILKKKAQYIRRALVATGIEVALVIVALILYRL
ncbi:MAG: hypothetical protein H0T57_01585 [Rubrobacter sp.]|nr:hypothetical protein [Rubrobacter sp.]